jgi:hypothetical protein
LKENIKNLSNINTEFFLATNSLCFDLKSEKEKVVLWVHPIWRIIKDNKVIHSSFSCPVYDDYENEGDYDLEFKKWCEKTNYLKNYKIINFQINKINDLKITWEDGSSLETFKYEEEEDENWYIQDENVN